MVARTHRALSAIDAAAAATLYCYLTRVARSASGTVFDAESQRLDSVGIARRLASPGGDGRPILVVYWGADAVAIALLPFLEEVFLASARAVTFIFDETFGGRVCAHLVERMGGLSTMLPPPSEAARYEQLRTIMRRRGSYAFAVDGGGPYFKVGNGVATLARTLEARVIPLAAVAHPALPWIHRSRISFPLPGCRAIAAVGAPIDARGADRQTIAGEIEAALTALAAVVRRTQSAG